MESDIANNIINNNNYYLNSQGNKNLKNFQKLKRQHLTLSHTVSGSAASVVYSKDSLLHILDFLTGREKYLFAIDVNSIFFEVLHSDFKNKFTNNDQLIKSSFIDCMKSLKEDFNKIEVFRNLLFNYGLSQPVVLTKYDGKYHNFVLYRSVSMISYHVFRDLQQLDFQKQNMGADSLILLTVLIKKTNSLIGLNLAYNNISDDGCKILKNCLEINKTIQSLNLECNSIGDLGLSYLTNAIVNHKTLKSLKLALNVITIVGMDSLVMALKSCLGNSQINVIDFKYNNYKIESDEKYKDFKFLKISYN